MGYIGGDNFLAVWLPGAYQEDAFAESYIHLLGDGEPPDHEAEEAAEPAPPSRGFIIRDWFGPSLLGPASRFLRGRC
jgi:hypothetical protein